MKRTNVLYAATFLFALSFAGQAFAKGGSMGGGQGHVSTGGIHQQMASTMVPVSGNGMQQRAMKNAVSQQGPVVGLAPMNLNQGGAVSSAVNQSGQMKGKATGTGTKQPPVTSITK